MHGRIEFALDESDRLVSLLAVDFAVGGEYHMGWVVEYPEAERQFQTMFEPIGLVLGRIIFEVHAVIYVIHTVAASESLSESRCDVGIIESKNAATLLQKCGTESACC